mmetsp:Transcript_7573/g.11510  ORF Transcript_7573/g.11510 Transcript_7573/m.11510 type:complete len:222 (-) Transcript_7573:98-763(-)
MRVGPPAVFLAPFSSTTPRTSSESSTVPPTCLTMRTSLRSTLVACMGSSPSRPSTASTAMGASVSEFWETTLEDRQVVTASSRAGFWFRSTGCAMDRRISEDFVRAAMKASVMAMGWMPFSSSPPAALSRLPARTQTLVVPSPASMSWALEISTSIFAVGWNTCISERIVAPSLVIITSPSPFSIILSIPRGPRLVRIALDTAFAAVILESLTSFSFRESL